MLKAAVSLLVLALSQVLLAADTPESEAAPVETEVHVKAATIREGSLPIALHVLGKIDAPQQTPASLMALGPGVVSKILVRDGEQVSSGTVLLKLDPRAAQAELRKAQSALALAQKEQRYAEKTGLAQQQSDLDLAAHQAAVLAAQTQKEGERLAALLAKSLVSEKAAADAQQLAETNRQNAKAAEKKASDFRGSGMGMEVERLRAKVEEARAALRQAEIEAESMTVRAPVAGRVTRLHATLGQAVEKGALLAEVVASRGVGAGFALPPAQASLVRPGMSFTLSEAHTSRIYEGAIVTVGASVEAETGLVRIEGLIGNKDGPKPYLGEILQGEISTGMSPKGFLVPLSALSVSDEGAFLHMIDAQHQARLIKVEVLTKNSQEAVVCAPDLKAGQQAVVDGNYNLPDGATVVVEAKQ